jgi:hypothetical protein
MLETWPPKQGVATTRWICSVMNGSGAFEIVTNQ